MSENPINKIIREQAWSGPSAMDRYHEFMQRYGKVIERRRAELRERINSDPTESPEIREAYDEFESIRNFEIEIHRLIHAFTAEATRPLQAVLTDIAMGAVRTSPFIMEKS